MFLSRSGRYRIGDVFEVAWDDGCSEMMYEMLFKLAADCAEALVFVAGATALILAAYMLI